MQRSSGGRIRGLVPQALVAGALVLTVSCGGCGPKPPPPIGTIELEPAELYAATNAQFTLRIVHVKDQDGNPLPQSRAAGATWSSSAALVSLPASASGASVLVTTLVAPGDADVKATVDGVEAAAKIHIVANGLATSSDWIVTDKTLSETPVVALLDGQTSAWENDKTVAFIGRASFTNFVSKCASASECGEVVLFSDNAAVTAAPVKWTDGCDVVASTTTETTACPTTNVTLQPPIAISSAVYIAASGADLMSTAEQDISLTKGILHGGRSGITFNPAPPIIEWPTKIVLDLAGPDWKCPTTGTYSVIQQLQDVGVPANTFPNSQTSIVYVDDLINTPALGSTPTGFFGYSCPWDPQYGAIVLISWASRRNTSLPHELGHALGPWGATADFGHTRRADGFDETNLMWPYEADWIPTSREFLSLGQAFQMSLASGSVLHRPGAATSGIACQTTPSVDVPCPKLSKSIGP